MPREEKGREGRRRQEKAGVGKRRQDTERRYSVCPAVSEGHEGVGRGTDGGCVFIRCMLYVWVCACARVSVFMYNTSAPSAGAMRKWTKWAKKSKGNQTLHPLSLSRTGEAHLVDFRITPADGDVVYE